MEFTFKLKKDNSWEEQDEEDEIRSVYGILQSIAKITFTQGEVFKAYEYLYSGQTGGIDAGGKSNITGFITIPDRRFQSIDSPNGKVDFVEFIGVTNDELLALRNKKTDVRGLYEKIGLDVTSYSRESTF